MGTQAAHLLPPCPHVQPDILPCRRVVVNGETETPSVRTGKGPFSVRGRMKSTGATFSLEIELLTKPRDVVAMAKHHDNVTGCESVASIRVEL